MRHLIDITDFTVEEIEGILDLGDILTLIEQAERAFDQAEAEEMAAKIAGDGDFTLQDFLGQLQQLRAHVLLPPRALATTRGGRRGQLAG